MSAPSGDGGQAAVQELLAHLSRRPQQSPRAEIASAAPPFNMASRSPQAPTPPSTHQMFAAPSSSTVVEMVASESTGHDRKASLLNLLNFGGQKEATSPTPNTRLSLSEQGYPSSKQHARGVSTSDLVGSSMGKPAGPSRTTPSPPADIAASSATVANPQDQLLQLLNKPRDQRPAVSPRGSYSGEASVLPAASPLSGVAAKASPAVDTKFVGTSAPLGTSNSPVPARDSPIRVFGSRESREPTPFEPQDIPTPPAKSTDKGIFTYVNPFEQLASSRKNGPVTVGMNGSVSKAENVLTSPTPEPVHKSTAENVEIASPAPLADGRTRVEALMGIGAPTTDPEVISQALDNISDQVEKQVAYVANQSKVEVTSPRKVTESDLIADRTGPSSKGVDKSGTDVKEETETEDVRRALVKLSTRGAADANQDMMDEAAAADDEDSSVAEDEFQVVPVYNIPLRPFVAIELTQSEPPTLSFRERSITDIARVKKEFDQIDRSLVTASNDYIVYATPKKPYGIRVIQQIDGRDRQLFKENDPVFNVAISSSPSGKNHQGIESVIATGTSGSVYWSVIRYDGRDQSQDEDVSKHCLVFPPFSGHDGDHTSGGQLKTRAKRSNRHPEFFAIGRGKTIQIVFPFHAMHSKFVKNGSVLDTEGYFKDRSIKISTGKAGKDFTFSEDDTVLASLDKAGRLRFWDVRDLVDENNGTASRLAPMEVNTPIMTVPTAHVNDKPWPTSVLFVDKLRPYFRGSALRYVIVGMKQNHTLQLWDLSLGKVVQELALPHENEPDAICSVAFHPPTGIIVVGHPTRNSIYLIHLSAPKYNLQGLTQAKYLQAIIQKNPNLPKTDSTAIMSGIREYSFASKGQIRSLDLLSSQSSTADKKPDDERGQFELYVMHSKGVTCLNIRKSDLGWSHDNKVITKVNGEEEGIIKVRSLQELKPVEVSEMSSVNGDAVGSTKGISSRARSPLPESQGGKDRDVGATSDVPMNGTPTVISTKSERRRKKRVDPAVEEAFDDIPPPAPVPPTVSQAPVTPRKVASSSVAKKEQKPVKTEIKEEPPAPIPQQLALPSTEAMPPVDSSALVESIQQELKQVESSVQKALTHAFETEFKTLRRGIDEDRRTAEATAHGHQQTILRLVSQSLTENVDAALNNIVVNNIQSKVVPAINQNTEKTLRKSIPEWLQTTLQQQVITQIKSSLPDAIGNAMSNQQVLKALTEGVTIKISKRIDREMQSTVVPQFQKVVTNAANELEARVTEQLKSVEAKANEQAKEDAAKIDKLTMMTEDLLETIRRMSEVQSAMRDEMSSMQDQISRLRASNTQPVSPIPPPALPVEAPVEDPKDRELQSIISLINEGRFEEGTIQWLQSPNQAEIFTRFFMNYDPSYLQQCPGLVTLSAGAAVISNLDDHVAQRLHWVTAALNYLDPLDDEVRTVAPKIMDIVIQRLESRYMSLAEANPTDPVLRQIPALVKKAREIKAMSSQ